MLIALRVKKTHGVKQEEDGIPKEEYEKEALVEHRLRLL